MAFTIHSNLASGIPQVEILAISKLGLQWYLWLHPDESIGPAARGTSSISGLPLGMFEGKASSSIQACPGAPTEDSLGCLEKVWRVPFQSESSFEVLSELMRISSTSER